MIELFKLSIIIHTDHDAIFEIAAQTSVSTFSIDELNLRLIRTSNYIQRFLFVIRYKFDKFHIVFDAFFRLFSINTFLKSFANNEEREFDVLFTAFIVEMNDEFKANMKASYKNNLSWKKIIDVLKKNHNVELLFF